MGNVNEFPSDIETSLSSTLESNFINTVEFNLIYRNLPETGTTTRNFAFSTANPKFQKVFQPHFKRIKLINCRNLHNSLAIGDDPRKCVCNGNGSRLSGTSS